MYGTLISSTTVGVAGAASITFSSISNAYTDLFIVLSGRATSAGNNTLNFNGSASSFANKTIYSFSSSAPATFTGSTDIGRSTSTSDQANDFGAMTIHIPNYASSVYKPFFVDSTAASYNGGYVFQNAGVWQNTAAITSVTINPPGGTFVQYTTAYLYGIVKGSGGATVTSA